MSWYTPNLYAAIDFRLNGDTGTGGLFNGSAPLVTGSYLEQMPTEQLLPAITMNEVSCINSDATRCRTARVSFEVHAWVARNPIPTSTGSEPEQPQYKAYRRIADIEKRIIGDWPSQVAGTGPTYGLDRFQPSLDAYTTGVTACGWTADTIRRTYVRDDDNDDILHRIFGFEILISEVAA